MAGYTDNPNTFLKNTLSERSSSAVDLAYVQNTLMPRLNHSMRNLEMICRSQLTHQVEGAQKFNLEARSCLSACITEINAAITTKVALDNSESLSNQNNRF